MPNEALLVAERERVRSEYEKEIEDMRKKMEYEKESKAKIQKEVVFRIYQPLLIFSLNIQ